MKKEELRKVEFNVYSETEFKFHVYSGYFHRWGDITSEQQIPFSENMYTTKTISNTVGIVEDEKTGEVFTISPNSITFLN